MNNLILIFLILLFPVYFYVIIRAGSRAIFDSLIEFSLKNKNKNHEQKN